MIAEELWKEFCEKKNIAIDTPHEAWAFGGAPDKLVDLVIKGIKTATASAYDLYPYNKEKVPEVGDYSIILNTKDEALCIIRTTSLCIKAFKDVTCEHAYKEGERDRTLSSWRNIHEEFFNGEYTNMPIKFTENSNVLCEEFELVYVPQCK